MNPPAILAPIDLSPWRQGNTGIAFATTIRAVRPGPHALIMALMHGNELCGAHAIAYLHTHQVRPIKGQITLAFANVAAYDTFDSRRSGDARFLDEDLNRVWRTEILDGQQTSRELRRARELRPLVESADYLLDLHAMENTGPPLVLTGLTERAVDLATRIGVPEYIVRDGGHANGTRLRDYGPFSTDDGDRTALLIECGQREHPDSASVAVDVSNGTRSSSALAPSSDGDKPVITTESDAGARFVTSRRMTAIARHCLSSAVNESIRTARVSRSTYQ